MSNGFVFYTAVPSDFNYKETGGKQTEISVFFLLTQGVKISATMAAGN